ncbi:MAG: hypothetical protein H6891_04775 [Brucellaceae bacterium]|nr:hypothetical protein [Brucellaceae bacterium]
MSGFRKVRMLHARAVLATCIGLLPSPALAGVVGTPDPAPTGVVIYMAAMLTVLGFGSVLAAAAGRWIWVLYGALAAYAVFWQSWEAQASGGAFWQGFEFTDHFVTRTGTIMDIWAMGPPPLPFPARTGRGDSRGRSSCSQLPVPPSPSSSNGMCRPTGDWSSTFPTSSPWRSRRCRWRRSQWSKAGACAG